MKDLFRLQGVIGLRLAAGQAGLQRTIRAAVLLEYQEERLMLSDYYRGDLVLSTLAYAREDTALVSSSLLALIRQGVGGLMIKTGYYPELPSDVLAEADRTGTPVFLFDESYIEEVLLEVTELIRGRAYFAGYEKDIDDLMSGTLTADQARERVRRIDPDGSGPAYLYAIDAGRQTQQLAERLFRLSEEESSECVFMSWRFLLLVLMHPKAKGESVFSPLEDVLVKTGQDLLAVRIGASSLCAAPEKLGEALCEAIYAVRTARSRHEDRVRACEMGLYGFLLPMGEHPFVNAQCRAMISALRDYDRKNGANLEQTAREYIRLGHSIPETAKAMYQHPNTVRYRLGKIRSIFGMAEDAPFETMLELVMMLSDITGIRGEML